MDMTKIIQGAVGVLLCASALFAEEVSQPKYLNPSLGVEERISDLLPRLSIKEKIELTVDMTPPVAGGAYGIPGFVRGEALRGMSGPRINEVTVWPAPICLAGSFNPQLIYEMGVMASDEGRAQRHSGHKNGRNCFGLGGPLLVYAPNLNMGRDPRWGRSTETYGEDPYLTGRMGVQFVKGMQGDHPRYLKMGACPKHFAANNVEDNRFGHNAVVSERWLRDYYFKGFMPSFLEANPSAVMTAYNAINGVPCAANEWLVSVLRKDWNWKGVVLEDASAAMLMADEDTRRKGNHHYVKTFEEAAALSLKAGHDFMLSGTWRKGLEKAIANGRVDEKELDRAVRQTMRLRIRLGELDPDELIPWSKLPIETLGCDKHTAHSRMAAQQGMVLLKNNGVLPLKRDAIKKIAVVGPNANILIKGGYSGDPKHPSTIASGLKEVAGTNVTVSIAGWQAGRAEDLINTRYSNTVGTDGVAGWKVEYFNNANVAGDPVATGFSPAIDFMAGGAEQTARKLPAGVELIHSARYSAEIVAPETGTYKLNAFFDDYVRVAVDGKEVIKFDGSHWRIERRGSIDLEKGKSYQFVVEYSNIDKGSNYQMLWERPASEEGLQFNETELASKADVVVAALGLVDRDEGEGYDRFLDRLHDDQMAMLKKVLDVNKNVVVVLVGGSPISDPELYKIAPAVLQAWYPGQAANAVADLLFGDVNPSGHLPCTIVKTWKDLPHKDDYEIDRGRTYMYFDKEPCFAFGYGLSYTEFEFSKLAVDSTVVTAGDTINVTCEVKNTGDVAGSDVVQVYGRESIAQPGQPKRRLIGFFRVADLEPGESRPITIPVKVQNLAYWNAKAHDYVVPKGNWTIELAESSDEIVDVSEITVQ
jgi:beta-glucosidase